MAKSVQSQIEEYKQSIKAGRERADKVKADAIAAGVWKTGPSASNASDNYNPTTVTDPVTRVQREKEDNSGVFSEKKSTPSQSQIRADVAKKNLERYLKSDQRKEFQKKQQQNLHAQAMLTGITDGQWTPEVDETEKKIQNEIDYWETEAKKERDAERISQQMAEIDAMDEQEKAAFDKYASKGTYTTAEEIDAYQNLKNKYGDRLDELVEARERTENQARAEQAAAYGAEKASTNGGAFLHSLLSVPANVVGGLTGTAARINDVFNGTGQYETLAQNTLGDVPMAYANAVRSTTQQRIEGEDPTLGRKALGTIYQGGMSALDTAARMTAGGPLAAATLAGTGSFASTMQSAAAQGASQEQALALATINSGIEAATEKLPLDELFKVAKGGAKPAAQIVKNVLKQMGIEILEEEASLIGTTLAEAAILQEKSGYNQQIMKAAAQGVPYEQAKAEADRALLAEAINTALVSGVAGFFGAAGAEYAGARYVGDTSQQEAVEAPQTVQAEEQTQTQENAEQTAPAAAEQPDPEQDQISALLAGIRENPKDQRQPDRLDEVMQELFSDKEAENAPKEQEAEERRSATFRELDDSDAPVQREQPYPGSRDSDWGADPFRQRKWTEMGDRKKKAFMHENPEVKEIFQNEAKKMLWDLSDTTRGERSYDEQLHYESGGEEGWSGIKRHTSEDIAELRDSGMSYDQIEKGLEAIAEDHGKENNANSKRIEFIINDRLRDGYKDFHTNERVPPNQEYIDMIDDKMLDDDRKESFEALLEDADGYTPPDQNAESGAPGEDIQRQSPTDGQGKGTGAAERNFTGKAAYQDLLKEGHVQPDRPGDVRPMEVPKTDGNGKRVTEFAANAYGAGVTTDEMANAIESLIQDGELGFNVRTNRESLENAAAEIKKKGPANVRNRITRSIESRKIKDGDIEQAILLYQKYANGDKDTDLDNASEMMVDLATMANITGRNLQLFKLLRKMTPEGQLLAVQKEVERNVQSLVSSGKVKKGYEAQIDESLKTEYLSAAKELQKAEKGGDADKIAEAEQKVKDAQNAIYASEAAKMPATFKAKWDAWRYMAMLGNAKTQVRNVAGNLMFEPYKVVKDRFAALVEKSLPQDQRTKSLMQDPALLNWAREDANTEDVTNALKYSAKLGDNTAKDQISEQMKVFDNKALEAARKFVAKVPQAGDMLFKNDYYSRSLAGFLKARGYTAAQVQSGQVSNDILNEARTYAINEAMKATFNDSNAFSDAISSIGRGAQDNPWKKALNVAAEGILPFRRTPANIIVRFTEYSPAGIAKGMWDMATHVRNGDMSAATAIDQITAGLTGTGVMMLGYMMAAGMNGIKLTGSGADEDEKRQGHQDYALEFAADGQEYSYRIDWAAPANLPLFVGANIYNAIKDAGADPDVSKFTAVIRGMGTAFEPMLALSCLSSFNDLVEGIRYAQEGEAVYNMAANVATSYFTQGIPALLRQGYQATQETKQTTFANDADPTIRDLQKTAANIPVVGAKFQTEKVNAWGETEDQGDWMARTFNSFINPGSLKKIDNSALEQEITRLNEVQTENVTPPTAGKTLSYTDKDGNAHKDVRLTEEQYQTLARTQGQTAKRILGEMIASKDYKALNDEQKALAIQQAYSYARKTAEIAAIEDHTGYDESWMMEMDAGAGTDYIIRRVTKSEISGAMDALDTAWDKGYDTTSRSDDLKWAYDTFSKMSDGAKADAREWLTGTAAKYVEAREKGVSHDAFVDIAKTINGLPLEPTYTEVRDIQKREAIANNRSITEKEKDIIMKAYMPDYNPSAKSPQTTELKYDAIRDLGVSPKGYTDAYRAYLDASGTGKRKRTIKQFMSDYGWDKSTATKVYDIYAGYSKPWE